MSRSLIFGGSPYRYSTPEYHSVLNTVVGDDDAYWLVVCDPDGLEDPRCDVMVLFGEFVPVWWRGWWLPEAGNSYDADGTVDVRLSGSWPLRQQPPDREHGD